MQIISKLPKVVLLVIIRNLRNHDSFAFTSTCKNLFELRLETTFWLRLIGYFGKYYYSIVARNLEQLERSQLSKCKDFQEEARNYSFNRRLSISFLKNQYVNRLRVDRYIVHRKFVNYEETLQDGSYDRFSTSFQNYISDIEITNIKTIPFQSDIIVGGYERDNGSPYLYIVNPLKPYEVTDLIYRNYYHKFNYTDTNPYAINSLDCNNNIIGFSNRFNNEIIIYRMDDSYTDVINFTNPSKILVDNLLPVLNDSNQYNLKIRFSSDSRFIAVGVNSGDGRVYDIEYMKAIWEVKQPQLPINNIIWGSNNSTNNNNNSTGNINENQLLSCGEIISNASHFYNNTGFIKIWDMRIPADSNTTSNKTRSWVESIECGDLSLSPDSNYLGYIMRKGISRNIDLRTNRVVSTFVPANCSNYNFRIKSKYHIHESLLWLPGAHNFIASTSEPRSINIWDSTTGKSIVHINTKQEPNLIKNLHIDIDCNGLYLFSNRGRLWGINDLSEISLFSPLRDQKSKKK